MALSLSEGLRTFKQGLDKGHIWAYWLAVKEEAWAIAWGAGLTGTPIAIITLYLSPSWKALGWTVAWCFLVAGYYVWRVNYVRLQQKLEMTKVRTHTWPHPSGGLGTQYYFGVVNESEAVTIRDIRVQLMEIIPEIKNLDWLPIPLHLKHDNPPSGVFTQSFDLHPKEPRNIDLFTTADATENSVAHFALSVSGVDFRVPITNRCRFRLMVNAKDVPVLFIWFALWMDESGTLQCEMEPVTGKN